MYAEIAARTEIKQKSRSLDRLVIRLKWLAEVAQTSCLASQKAGNDNKIGLLFKKIQGASACDAQTIAQYCYLSRLAYIDLSRLLHTG